jgi:myosin-crossreactive antigen
VVFDLAFQPWHSAVELKRYLERFTHMVSGFSTLGGIMRTVYNQYDSLVRPLYKWLEDRAVQFLINAQVDGHAQHVCRAAKESSAAGIHSGFPWLYTRD